MLAMQLMEYPVAPMVQLLLAARADPDLALHSLVCVCVCCVGVHAPLPLCASILSPVVTYPVSAASHRSTVLRSLATFSTVAPSVSSPTRASGCCATAWQSKSARGAAHSYVASCLRRLLCTGAWHTWRAQGKGGNRFMYPHATHSFVVACGRSALGQQSHFERELVHLICDFARPHLEYRSLLVAAHARAEAERAAALFAAAVAVAAEADEAEDALDAGAP